MKEVLFTLLFVVSAAHASDVPEWTDIALDGQELKSTNKADLERMKDVSTVRLLSDPAISSEKLTEYLGREDRRYLYREAGFERMDMVNYQPRDAQCVLNISAFTPVNESLAERFNSKPQLPEAALRIARLECLKHVDFAKRAPEVRGEEYFKCRLFRIKRGSVAERAVGWLSTVQTFSVGFECRTDFSGEPLDPKVYLAEWRAKRLEEARKNLTK